jgi:SpoVK/Ycf46/Vps4 family AAA+-type ATPase
LSENGSVDTGRLSKMKARELAAVHGVHFKGEAGDFAEVGGFDLFKTWMRKRRWAFGQEARDAGVDQPKGVVFVGVPGGGKTLMGVAAAGELGLPLIIFNPSECEGGIVGETATRTAEALRTIDALAPCVVLVDEIEKIFGGPGNLDGGSKSGMLRLLLIWLQERESDSFTMITSNDISGLPPELTRRGRVDEIWWCDLPGQRDREEILRIHLAKRGRELQPKTVACVAEKLDGYTGSEIEQVVKEGHLTAYCRKCEGGDGELTSGDLIDAAAPITPMAITYEEKLTYLRSWAQGRARFASAPEQELEPVAAEDLLASVPSPDDDGSAPTPGTPLFRTSPDTEW